MWFCSQYAHKNEQDEQDHNQLMKCCVSVRMKQLLMRLFSTRKSLVHEQYKTQPWINETVHYKRKICVSALRFSSQLAFPRFVA